MRKMRSVPRTTMLRVLLLLFAQLSFLNAQQSFSATKFELNPDLPIEDLTVAGFHRDEKPATVNKNEEEEEEEKSTKADASQPKDKSSKQTTTVAPTTQQQQTTTTTQTPPPTESTTHAEQKQTQQPQPQAPQQQQQIVPLSENNSQAVIPPHSLQHAQTPPQAQPMPHHQTEAQPQAQTQPSPQAQTQSQAQTQQAAQSQQNRAQKPLRADAWFRENFDIIDCPRDGETVARAFNRKFPRNLLRDGKETVLAELLTTRIRECRDKEERQHWSQIDAVVAQSAVDTPITEREECIAGLIEEQIACMNIISYSCQFIQPEYAFRLLPTRIIVQEARYAEDGAEKCRKFVRKLKGKTPR